MRDIVIGDVHGCLDELNELLCVVSYKPGRDQLAFVGDLVDRGPDSIGVIRRVRELGVPCVMGNHDEWYARCAKHADTERHAGKTNPLRKHGKYTLFEKMSEADLSWLAALPYLHRIDERTVVTHAGFRPGIPVAEQDRGDMLRMRYLRRATGERWNMKSDELLTPDVAAFWTEVWTGPEDVIYGHHPSKSGTVKTEVEVMRKDSDGNDVADYVHCWGIDTGCCFGNRLTAWVRDRAYIDKVDLVSVPARSQYAAWRESMKDA